MILDCLFDCVCLNTAIDCDSNPVVIVGSQSLNMSFPWTSFSTNGERKLVPTKMITSVYFHNKSCIFLGIIHVSPNLQLLLSSVETDLALSSVERQHGREHCFKERPAVVSGDNLGNGVVSGILRLGNYYSLPHAVFDYNRHVHSIQQYIIYIYIYIYSLWL